MQEPVFPKTNYFAVIPKSLANLTHIETFDLDLQNQQIQMTFKELPNFALLNWVVKLQEEDDEIITFMAQDEQNNILCMLQFFGLEVLEHKLGFNKSVNASLVHSLLLRYETIERAENILQTPRKSLSENTPNLSPQNVTNQ